MASSTLLFTIFFFLSLSSQVDLTNGSPLNYHIIPLQSVTGPESLVFEEGGGGPYTGVSDGRILKWEGFSLGWKAFAAPPQRNSSKCDGTTSPALEEICGRPLGLKFHIKKGTLYVADAYFGLLAVESTGGAAKQLSTAAEGQPFALTNGVDVDQETGIVYFTDSSTRYKRRDWLNSVAMRDATGRFLSYDPETKQTLVLLRNLQFPNGVAVSRNGDFVLIAETTRSRILRFWLKGMKKGQSEVFAELSWPPDNIQMNSEGEFWVAVKSLAINVVGVKLDREGRVLEVFPLESTLGTISEVHEQNGTLWLGSVESPFVAVHNH